MLLQLLEKGIHGQVASPDFHSCKFYKNQKTGIRIDVNETNFLLLRVMTHKTYV